MIKALLAMATMEMLIMVMMMMTMMMPTALASELQSQLTVPNHHNFLDRARIGQRIHHLLINFNLLLQQQLGEKVACNLFAMSFTKQS